MRGVAPAWLAVIACGIAAASPAHASGSKNVDCVYNPTEAEQEAYTAYYTDHFDFEPGKPIPEPTEAVKNALGSQMTRCASELGWDKETFMAAFEAKVGNMIAMGVTGSIPLNESGQNQVFDKLVTSRWRDLRIIAGDLKVEPDEYRETLLYVRKRDVWAYEPEVIDDVIRRYGPALAMGLLMREDAYDYLRSRDEEQ